MNPARGLAFIKPIVAEDRIGSIYAPPSTVDRMTASQFEVVAVGRPEYCEDEKCREKHVGDPWSEWAVIGREELRQHRVPKQLVPGAWVYVTPRSWVATHQRDLYVVKISAILGVFQQEKVCRSSSSSQSPSSSRRSRSSRGGSTS
jgi:hypothetical protein